MTASPCDSAAQKSHERLKKCERCQGYHPGRTACPVRWIPLRSRSKRACAISPCSAALSEQGPTDRWGREMRGAQDWMGAS